MIIQSTQNPNIKHVIHLHNKNFRAQEHEFIAQGLKTCKTLQDAGYRIKAIFMTEKMYASCQDEFLVPETHLVTDAIMQHMSTTVTATGILAIFEMVTHPLVATSNAAVLCGIQDPGNLGTLIRTASAMKLETLYLIESVDLYNPKVIQATTGALGNLKIVATSWEELSPVIGSIPTCALVVRSGKRPEQIPLRSSILVIGNEGQGLSEIIIKKCTYEMTIPMPGNTESLNAAVAGSIAMYLKTNAA